MAAEVYLDNNATTPLIATVRDAMAQALERHYGNPSSAHRAGERARREISLARDSVADFVGAPSESVIFGSGATELNNWVIFDAVRRARGGRCRLVVSEVEHPSVLRPAEAAEDVGAELVRIPVKADGRVSLDALRTALEQPASLVSIQWVNNETGVIQPVAEIWEACQAAGVTYHCDAAQALGKLSIDFSQCPVDLLTGSAHKMHGPAGVGLLVTRKRTEVTPAFYGGGQEFGLRPGTENVLGIIGFGHAAAVRRRDLERAISNMKNMRDRFEKQLKKAISNIRINGSAECRVCNTSNITFPGFDGSMIVALLDQQGVRCSLASACHTGFPEPSHVLTAMGLTAEEAYSSIRFSFSDQNTIEDVDIAVTKVVRVTERLCRGRVGDILGSKSGALGYEI